MDADAQSRDSQPIVSHHLTLDTPLIVHPDREMKVQVLLGEHTGKSYKSLKSSGFKAAVVNVVLSQVGPSPHSLLPVFPRTPPS